MKKRIKTTVFNFWKDNRKDQHYTLTINELKEKYLTWLKSKDLSWVTYYGHATVAFFVSDNNGLSSVGEMKELPEMEDQLMKTRHTLYPNKETV